MRLTLRPDHVEVVREFARRRKNVTPSDELSVRNSDHLSDRPGIFKGTKHEIRDVSSRDRDPPTEVLPECGSVMAALRSVCELRRSDDGPVGAAFAKNLFHLCKIRIVLAESHFC